MRFQFKSLKSDQFAYLYDSQSYQYNSNNFYGLHSNLFQYDTYGDGMIQHSNPYPVSTSNYQDCIVSLTSWLVYNLDKIEEVNFCFNDIGRKAINFFNDLKYDEKKRKYYNKSELKVSSSDSKRYDKRWKEIPDWKDTTISSLRRILNMNYISEYGGCAFDYLVILVQIEDALDNFSGSLYGLNEVRFEGMTPDEVHSMYYKFKNLFNLLKMGDAVFHAWRTVKIYNERLEKEEK